MKAVLILIFFTIILIAIIAHFVNDYKQKNNPDAKLNTNNANNTANATSTADDTPHENETAGSMEHNTTIVDINIEDLAEELRESYALALDPVQEDSAVLFALVTCHHCIRTQRYLKSNAMPFKVIHVDLFDGDARKNIMSKLRSLNERGSFPTLVMPSGDVIVGYKEAKIREEIEKYGSR